MGANYNAEVGYIRRKGYYELNPIIQYKFYPSSSKIADHGPSMKMDMFFNPSMNLTDRETQLLYMVEWMNKSILVVDVKDTYIKLLAPFDPTNTHGIPFAADSKFNWKEMGVSFTSDIRKTFNWLVSSRYGGYYNGTRTSVNAELYYRVQPYGSLAIVSSYNNISMPSPYKSAEFFLSDPDLILPLPIRYSSQVSFSIITRSTI